MSLFSYKGYEGTAETDTERLVCRGKILFINDVVTYEAISVAELRREFEAAVDDYLQTCEEIGKAPDKPFKGQFNVRFPPELHKRAAIRAAKDGSTLNAVVTAATEQYLCTSSNVVNNYNLTLQQTSGSDLRELTVSGSETESQWGDANVH